MANLPKVSLPTGSVEIAGETVEFHSLSRSQALKVHTYEGREDEAEDFILACGTDISVEDAHAWRDSVDLATAGLLTDAIIEVSGLTGESAPLQQAPLKAVK